MAEEIIGIEVEGRIIVSHRTTQVILIIACHRTVDVVAGMFWQQMNTFREVFFSLLPFLTGQADDGTFCPRTTIIRVQFQTLV